MWWIQSNPTAKPATGSSNFPELERANDIHLGPLNSNPWVVAPAAEADKPAGYDPRIQPPTSKLTATQLFYLFVIQGIGALIVAGGINFAAGYAIYSTPRPPPGPPPLSPPPFLFSLPTSLLADTALTTILESVVTWFCSAVLVNRDLSRGRIPPLHLPPSSTKHPPIPIPPRRQPGRHREGGAAEGRRGPSNRVVRWFLFLDHYNAERGSAVFCGCGRSSRVLRAIGFALAGLGRGLIVAVAGFAVMVGPTIGLLVAAGTPYHGDWVFLGRWDGAVFKLLYGGALAMVISPALALMWMVRAGWIVGGRR